jgi:hypothetical protein
MKSMHSRVLVAALVGLSLLGTLAACAPTIDHPAVEPVTVSANKLQGETVKVPLDSELNIATGDLSVTSYSGSVADSSIARFVPGSKTSTLELDPSVKPLKVGETTVTLKNKDGGIQNVTFTIDVTK